MKCLNVKPLDRKSLLLSHTFFNSYIRSLIKVLTPALSFLLLYVSVMSSSLAADVTTSFETTNTSGMFTLGTSPKTVTFTDGEARFAGLASLYHSGSQAFMVQNDTAMITFETPAAMINVFLKAQSGAAGAMVNVYDVDDTLVNSYTASTSWQEIAITSTEGISRMELINNTSSFAVFDDFSFTAMTAPTPPGDPIELSDPIALPIFSGGLKLKLEMFTEGMTAPLWGTTAPGVNGFFYIIDQVGSIWAIDDMTGAKTLVADLASTLVTIGIPQFGGFDERGLLGIAFHPQFATNNLLYTYGSQNVMAVADFSTMPMGMEADHQGVLTEWQASIGGAAGIMLDMSSVREVLRIDEPQFNHNGGAIAFDADGMLYIAIGDGGGADDVDGQMFIDSAMVGHGTLGNGQNMNNPLGSILRIDPMGTNSSNGAYGIPSNNPFVGEAGLDEIYAYGLRNPYRLSFDSQTGALYAADVGQNDVEEINLITAGGNYGWNIREGSFGFFANGNDDGYVFEQMDNMGMIDPMAEYDHDEGVAVIGGFVYRGTDYPDMQGNYVFGDYNGRLFYINNEGTISEFQDVDTIDVGAVLGFGQDNQGELYVMANATGLPSGTSGTAYKITLMPNRAPMAVTGDDQTVNEGVMVTLDASMSSDPDGDTVLYEWTQSAGTMVTLSSNTSAMPTFMAPSVSADMTLTFVVTVNDGHLADMSEVNVMVNNVVTPTTPTTQSSSSSGGGSLSILTLLVLLLLSIGREYRRV